MTETANVMMHITELRVSTQYQKAISKIQLAKPEDIKAWSTHKNCSEYADLRITIGIWERLAMTISHLGAEQDKVYSCTPVGLMWDILEPAIANIRETEELPNYASQFEKLKDDYECWGKTESGKNFGSISDQAICALFG